MVLHPQQNKMIALPVGSMIQHFQIDKILGQGHFGIVYKAWDSHLEIYRAIKEYFPTQYAQRFDGQIIPIQDKYQELFKQGKYFFEQEARALAKIDHPNIVKVISCFHESNSIYTIMEYIDGQNLNDFMSESAQTISPELLQKWLSDLLDAISLLHEKSIFHRDIKPENILIDHKKQPVIIDFGAAQYYLQSDEIDYSNIASPPYSPLELYDQTQKDTQASIDIYGLGQVFYELISKEKAIPALRRTQQFDPQPPLSNQKKLKHFSKNLLKSIDIATQPLPENRFEDITQWQAGLNGNFKQTVNNNPHTSTSTKKYTIFLVLLLIIIGISIGAWLFFNKKDLSGGGNGDDSLEICFSHLNQQKIQQAEQCFNIFANQKHPEALFQLGKLYKEQNPELAFNMTMQAAQVHHVDAMYLLSWYYQDGIGTTVNHDKALEWLNSAGEKKHIAAIQDLIKIYSVLHENDPSHGYDQQIEYWENKLNQLKQSAGSTT